MAIELATGYVSIVPSARGFGSKLGKEISGDLGRAGTDAGRRAGNGFATSFGAGVRRAVGVLAAAFAGRQIVSGLTGAITAASDLGEVTSKSVQIFGAEALPELEAFSDTAARAFGQSKTQALEAASTFAVFGKSAGLGGKDLTGFATELTTLTADMASFANTTPEEAIQAVGAALRGESEPIRKYGVLLDDATLRQRALALGLVSTTKQALTPQQRVLAAHAEILAQTGDIQGDFARTSDGLANQQRILNALWQDGKTQLGQALLPAATAVVGFLASQGIPGFLGFAGAVADSFREIKDSVNGIAGFGETVAVEIGKMFGWAEDDSRVEAMAGVFRTIQDVAAEVFFAVRDAVIEARDVLIEVFTFVSDNQDVFLVAGTGVATAAASFFLLNEALLAVKAATAALSTIKAAGGLGAIITGKAPLLAHPYVLIAVAIVALAAAAFVAYKKFKPFRDVVDSVARVVRDVAVAAFEKLQEIVEDVAPVLEDVFNGVSDAVSTVSDVVGEAVSTVRTKVGEFTSAFSDVSDKIISEIEPLVGWIDEHLISTLAAAGEFVETFVQTVLDRLSPFVETWIAILSPILNFTKGLFSGIFDFVTAILPGIIDFAERQISFLGDVFQSFIDLVTPIWNTFWDVLSVVVGTALEVAKGIVESVLGSIRGVFEVGTGLLEGDWEAVWEGLNTILDSTLGGAVQIVEDILGGVKDAVTEVLSDLGDTAKDAIGDVSDVLFDIGGDIIKGLVDGIKDAIPDVTDVLKGITDKIPFDKGPPAKDRILLRPAGELIIEGFIAGIARQLPALRAKLGDITDLAVATITPDMAAFQQPALATTSTPTPAVAGGSLVDTVNITEAQDASAVIDELNARLGWMLTARNER